MPVLVLLFSKLEYEYGSILNPILYLTCSRNSYNYYETYNFVS